MQLGEDKKWISTEIRIDKLIIDLNTAEENKEYFRRFDRDQRLNGRTIATRSANKMRLYYLFKRYVTKDFQKLSRDDFEEIILDIESRDNYSEKTKSNWKRTIKQLDRFLNPDSQPRTAWIKASPRKRKLNTLTYGDLPTSGEIQRMVLAADSLRDKTIISVWGETGMRPKELRTLLIKSKGIVGDVHVLQIDPDNKTGCRAVPIFESVPILTEYMRHHPNRDNPNAPLWHPLYKTGKPFMGLNTFNDVLKNAAKKAGIEKRIYWYVGRHNSYTRLIIDGWSEPMIKARMGLDPASNVLDRYNHMLNCQMISYAAEMHEKSMVPATGEPSKLVKFI